jgi:hypothetical protein
VVLVHVSSDATKRIELNEIGPRWNLTGREGRGCVRLGACVRGITDSRRRPTDRPTAQRDLAQRDRLASDKRLEMGRGGRNLLIMQRHPVKFNKAHL